MVFVNSASDLFIKCTTKHGRCHLKLRVDTNLYHGVYGTIGV